MTGKLPMAILRSVHSNSVGLVSGATANFAFPIGDVIDFEEVVVVRLEIPRESLFNESVYGIGPDGNIVWQIAQEYPAGYNMAWGGLENRDGAAVVSNSESKVCYIDPKTGHVLSRGISAR